jgi:hypothetical protein
MLNICNFVFKNIENSFLNNNNNNNTAYNNKAIVSSTTTTNNNNNNNSTSSDSDLIYEIMSLEATLVCVFALLLYSPELLTLQENCLNVIVNGLEISFHAVKGLFIFYFTCSKSFINFLIVLRNF